MPEDLARAHAKTVVGGIDGCHYIGFSGIVVAGTLLSCQASATPEVKRVKAGMIV